jgi:hypothetical protein
LVSEVQALQVLDIDGEHKECLTSCIRLLLKVGRNKEALKLADTAAALPFQQSVQGNKHLNEET